MGKRGPKPKPFECPENIFWYLVGLIATDGCLSHDGRHIDITSVDKIYLTQIKEAVGFRAGVTKKSGGPGRFAYHMQIGSVDLYQKLASIGLTPRKSLTLGPLNVPDSGFKDFLRGVIDGDGCIRSWIHPTNGREQWSVRVVSASGEFILWVSGQIEQLWNVKGQVHEDPPRKVGHHTKYILKYGKLAAKVILRECYYQDALALERKAKLAAECIITSVGWSKSGTVEDESNWRGWQYQHVWSDKTSSRILDSNAQRSYEENFVLTCG